MNPQRGVKFLQAFLYVACPLLCFLLAPMTEPWILRVYDRLWLLVVFLFR